MISTPGVYDFAIEIDSAITKSGSIMICPTLTSFTGTSQSQIIRVQELAVQTFVPKWMGRIDQWGDYLAQSASLGYNMIHFVPFQERGASNSPYSIKNHLEISSDYFADSLDAPTKLKELSKFIDKIDEDYGLLSAIDIVWNHIAFDSPWLVEHPDAGYNLSNSPHLKIAFELDEAILEFSRTIADHCPITKVTCIGEVDVVVDSLRAFIRSARLWEFHTLDTWAEMDKLEKLLRSDQSHRDTVANMPNGHALNIHDFILQDPSLNRFSKYLNTEELLKYLKQFYQNKDDNSNIQICLQMVEMSVLEANRNFKESFDRLLDKAVENIRSRFIYERIDEKGPKKIEIDSVNPVVSTYFTRIVDDKGQSVALANNGWIWNADPLINFANPTSNSYFLREIIVWGDCVKLRYGSCPEDNPWLWNHMKEYTLQMASIFDGFRIDNCHSTPMHVAQYFLDAARLVRPNLFVFAELFTGSAEVDDLFVWKLGLNAIIREAMYAWNSAELARLAHLYSGPIVGSLAPGLHHLDPLSTSKFKYKLQKCTALPLFFDCTHDNETPSQKRLPEDTLPNAMIVAACNSAIGSVFGYDLILPKTLNIVSDNRLYKLPSRCSGILQAKKLLLALHRNLSLNGYNEQFVHHQGNFIQILRENPMTGEGYAFISHSAFQSAYEQIQQEQAIIKVIGKHCDFVLYSSVKCHRPFVPDLNFIIGIESDLELETDKIPADSIQIEESIENGDICTRIILNNFHPGSILVLKKRLPASAEALVRKLLITLNDKSFFFKELSQLSLEDFNILLYKSEAEEYDCIGRYGYDIPGKGKLAYCGIESFFQEARKIQNSNNLDHPLCANLRNGDWVFDFISSRLKEYAGRGCKNLQPIASKIEELTKLLKQLPFYLKPKFFIFFICSLHKQAMKAIRKLLDLPMQSHPILFKLLLGSVQLLGRVNSTSLDPRTPICSLAAGLPHFAVSHMRCWGRDIFISFKGMFLLTNRFAEAREHLLAFASAVYRGLVPNLLDASRRPRYNSRDACWWFLQALQEYCNCRLEFENILEEKVKMRFDGDEYIEHTDPRAYSKEATVKSIVHQILQSHFEGIHFTEWNAGPNLDHAMKTEGFKIDISVNTANGFIYGGNKYNCGTWMDKMGDSVKAGIFGIPATPRNGANVEIVGLLASALNWISKCPKFQNLKKFTDKSNLSLIGDQRSLEAEEWLVLLKQNFQEAFYIDQSTVESKGNFYKDFLPASDQNVRHQLRPNFLIALSVAPFLAEKSAAKNSIKTAELYLKSAGIGMKTLDPEDPDYRGDYFNGLDNDDPHVAHGFNYHQGPVSIS